jgi:hypothetical protein
MENKNINNLKTRHLIIFGALLIILSFSAGYFFGIDYSAKFITDNGKQVSSSSSSSNSSSQDSSSVSSMNSSTSDSSSASSISNL